MASVLQRWPSILTRSERSSQTGPSSRSAESQSARFAIQFLDRFLMPPALIEAIARVVTRIADLCQPDATVGPIVTLEEALQNGGRSPRGLAAGLNIGQKRGSAR